MSDLKIQLLRQQDSIHSCDAFLSTLKTGIRKRTRRRRALSWMTGIAFATAAINGLSAFLLAQQRIVTNFENSTLGFYDPSAFTSYLYPILKYTSFALLLVGVLCLLFKRFIMQPFHADDSWLDQMNHK